MPVFDISSVVAHSETVMDRGVAHRFKNIRNVVDWLTENVGDYYGHGEDHTIDVDGALSGHAVLHIGSGWQIEQDWKGDPGGYVEVWVKVDITDEVKSTLFALKWIK